MSAALGRGELVALVGPNGSGKTTLLEAIAGVQPRARGRAFHDGKERRRGSIGAGFVHQNPWHQFVSTSVRKELEVGSAAGEGVETLLEEIGLTEHADRHPMTLSGGQARRLSVATMHDSPYEVLCLDEPTYGQDPANIRRLVALIEQLRARGHTVIVATHDVDFVLHHASRVIALPERQRAEEEPVGPEPRPPHTRRRLGLFERLYPLTLFAGILPVFVLIFFWRLQTFHLAVMVACSVGYVVSLAPWRRILGCLAAIWGIWAILLFSAGHVIAEYQSPVNNALMDPYLVAALIALVLVSGIGTSPHRMLSALVDDLHVPYRLASAGVAALDFMPRFRREFATLRRSRRLRGIGLSWGVAAPVYRWCSSFVPLCIIAVRHAEKVAMSMDTRAFGAFPTRTSIDPTAWRWWDTVLLIALWIIGAVGWWFYLS